MNEAIILTLNDVRKLFSKHIFKYKLNLLIFIFNSLNNFIFSVLRILPLNIFILFNSFIYSLDFLILLTFLLSIFNLIHVNLLNNLNFR